MAAMGFEAEECFASAVLAPNFVASCEEFGARLCAKRQPQRTRCVSQVSDLVMRLLLVCDTAALLWLWLRPASVAETSVPSALH